MDAVKLVAAVSFALLFFFVSWVPVDTEASEVKDTVEGISVQHLDFHPEDDAGDWEWPDDEDFAARWANHVAEASVIRVVIGDVTFEPDDDGLSNCDDEPRRYDDAILGIAQGESSVGFFPIMTEQRRRVRALNRSFDRAAPFSVIHGVEEWDGGELKYENLCGQLIVEPRYVSDAGAPQRGALADRVYTRTLLEYGDDIVKEPPQEANSVNRSSVMEEVKSGDPEARRKAIRTLLASNLEPTSRFWQRVLDELNRHGDDELARQVHRRFRPMGHCSMDETPQNTARAFSEVCARLGDTGCFLQLRVRLLKNNFRRVAWSSMGEKAHDPAAEALMEAPIDVGRFLRGAMVTYELEGDIEMLLTPGRIGEAVATEYQEMIDVFAAMAADERLDELNRLNAAVVVHTAARIANRPQWRQQLNEQSIPTSARVLIERLD